MSRRKELKNCVIGVQDGFSGTALVNDTLAADDTTMAIDTLDLHDDATLVPVGARFRTEGINTIRTVTASNNSMQWLVTVDASSGNFTVTFEGQTTASIAENAAASAVQSALEALSNVAVGELLVTGSSGGPYTITAAGTLANTSGLVLTVNNVDLSGGAGTVTRNVVQDGTDTWEVTFTPAIATGSVPANDDDITWLPQRVVMKVGSGNIEWTETDTKIFDTDRGLLDGVRDADETPMEVSASFVFDWMRASSGGAITVYEALHKTGGASGWHNAATDPCEPYCVELFIEDIPPCGSEQAEVIIFPAFYKEKINPTFQGGLVNLSGKCKATKPVITRQAVSVVQGT